MFVFNGLATRFSALISPFMNILLVFMPSTVFFVFMFPASIIHCRWKRGEDGNEQLVGSLDRSLVEKFLIEKGLNLELI